MQKDKIYLKISGQIDINLEPYDWISRIKIKGIKPACYYVWSINIFNWHDIYDFTTGNQLEFDFKKIINEGLIRHRNGHAIDCIYSSAADIMAINGITFSAKSAKDFIYGPPLTAPWHFLNGKTTDELHLKKQCPCEADLIEIVIYWCSAEEVIRQICNSYQPIMLRDA